MIATKLGAESRTRASRDRLFVSFNQLDAGLAKQHGGTGLGLALPRRIVEEQGGQVGVESTLGQGSLFYAVLPRVARKAAVAGRIEE